MRKTLVAVAIAAMTLAFAACGDKQGADSHATGPAGASPLCTSPAISQQEALTGWNGESCVEGPAVDIADQGLTCRTAQNGADMKTVGSLVANASGEVRWYPQDGSNPGQSYGTVTANSGNAWIQFVGGSGAWSTVHAIAITGSNGDPEIVLAQPQGSGGYEFWYCTTASS